MMEDKDVGELWTRAIKHRWAGEGEIVALIRKLVEERQLVHSLNNIISEGEPLARGDSIDGTLEQFGIDPATWGEA